MVKSEVFKNGKDFDSYDGTVNNGPSAQFNRFLMEHPEIRIMDIKYNDGDIFVLYEDPDNFIVKPAYMIEGRYYINTTAGIVKRCADGVDVSYMIKDFDYIKSELENYNTSSTKILDMIHNEFTFNTLFSYEIDRSDGGPIGKIDIRTHKIPINKIVYPTYILGCETREDYEFKLLGNPNNLSQYKFNPLTNKLIRVFGNLDLSYILNVDIDKFKSIIGSLIDIKDYVTIRFDGTNFILESNNVPFSPDVIIFRKYI